MFFLHEYTPLNLLTVQFDWLNRAVSRIVNYSRKTHNKFRPLNVMTFSKKFYPKFLIASLTVNILFKPRQWNYKILVLSWLANSEISIHKVLCRVLPAIPYSDPVHFVHWIKSQFWLKKQECVRSEHDGILPVGDNEITVKQNGDQHGNIMPTNCFLLFMIYILPTLELRSIKENGNYLSTGEGWGGGIFTNLGIFFWPLYQFQFSTFDPHPPMMKNKSLTPSTHFSTQFDNHIFIKTIVDM